MAVGEARLRPQTKAYGAARAILFAYSRQEWPPFIAAEERVPSAYCVDALLGKHGFSEVSMSLHKPDLHSRRHHSATYYEDAYYEANCDSRKYFRVYVDFTVGFIVSVFMVR